MEGRLAELEGRLEAIPAGTVVLEAQRKAFETVIAYHDPIFFSPGDTIAKRDAPRTPFEHSAKVQRLSKPSDRTHKEHDLTAKNALLAHAVLKWVHRKRCCSRTLTEISVLMP